MDVTQHMHYASRPETVAQAWKKIKALILAEVGLAKLNLPYLKKRLPTAPPHPPCATLRNATV